MAKSPERRPAPTRRIVGKAPLRKKSTFEYKPRDPKVLKDHANQSGRQFDAFTKDGFDLYKPKVGKNSIRILPPTWSNADHYALEVWVHSYIGASGGSYLCLNKMQNKPCAICAASQESKAADEADEAKKLAASRRYLCWVIDRTEDSPMPPKIYNMSWTVDKEIAELCQDDSGTIWIDHHEQGHDLSFHRAGTTMETTKYTARKIAVTPTPISDDPGEQDEILDFIQENPMTSMLLYHDNQYLKDVIAGGVEDPDELDDAKDEVIEEAEEEAAPPPRRVVSKRAPARAAAAPVEEEEAEEEVPFDEDEPTEEFEEEVAEEEEEEAAPPPRRVAGKAPAARPAAKPAARRAAPVEEEVDEYEEEAVEEELVEEVEEEVDEEEETSPPPRRTKPAARPVTRRK